MNRIAQAQSGWRLKTASRQRIDNKKLAKGEFFVAYISLKRSNTAF